MTHGCNQQNKGDDDDGGAMRVSGEQQRLHACLWVPSGSCPNLIMSRSEAASLGSDPVTLTPQLLPRVHRPLFVSVSSDSSGRFKALETPEWKNNLKAQVCA